MSTALETAFPQEILEVSETEVCEVVEAYSKSHRKPKLTDVKAKEGGE
jgi:hypothetical protein